MESPGPIFRFGPYEVRPYPRELYKHGIKLKIRPQPLLVLHKLVSHPGDVVTRDQLRQQLWSAETFVDFEHSLNTAMKELRGVLGDAVAEPRYIQTLPRLGYRFIAPVEQVSEMKPTSAPAAPLPIASPAPERPSVPAPAEVYAHRERQVALVILIVLIASATGYFAWSAIRGRPQPATNAAAKSSEVRSASVPGPSTNSTEAHELYLKGMYFWNKRKTAALQQAIEYFQQATTADPNYAPAYAGLANSYTLLAAYSSSPSTLYIPQARAAAARALELDPNLAEAHTAMALIVQNYDWDWQTSEKEFRRAIELNPDYATAHHWYAEHLMWLGRFDEALKESQKAQQLDPLSLIIAADQGAILYYARQYDPSIEQFRSVLRKDPNFPRAGMIMYAYTQKGMFVQALRETEAGRRVYGDGAWYWTRRAYIYGRAGRLEEARRELQKIEKLSRQEEPDPAIMLWAHLGTGNKEEALADLQKAYAEHSSILTALKVEPAFDPLRSDPRFQDLLRRVHLA